ncbi:MAG: ATP12 family chaperone protein [Geminicoccaceae bacterium]
MKRFYKATGIDPAEGGFRVLLDGRALKTPARRELLLPVEGLAVAVAEEWDEQGEEIVPDAMPITRLASTAGDRMPDLRESAIREVAGYAETDLVCYRASSPDDLVRRQHDAWQSALDWMAKRYDISFEVTVSLLPVPQPNATLRGVRDAVAAIDDWPLVGVHGATTGLGSVVLALALWHGELDADAATDASLVDASFEIERWGQERDASRRHETLRRDIRGAARFLEHLAPEPRGGRATDD